MSADDVDGSEMNGNHEIDDATAEALIAGLDRDADPVLSDLLGDVRTAYSASAPVMSAALASFIAGAPSPQPPARRRITRMRSLLTTKLAVAVASVVAGSGGLAVAGALPAPVQSTVSSAASHVGLNLPGHASPRAVEVTSNNPASGVAKTHLFDVGETPTSTPGTVAPEPTDPPQTCSTDTPDTPDTPTTVAPTDPSPSPTDLCPPADGHDGSGDNQSGDQHQSGGQNQSGDNQSGDQHQSGDTGGSQTTSGGRHQSGDSGGGSQSGGDQGGSSQSGSDQSGGGQSGGGQSGSDHGGSSSGGDQTTSTTSTTVASGN